MSLEEEEIQDLCKKIEAKESLPSIVQFLDTHPNLDLDVISPSGWTALIHSCQYNNPEATSLLIERGANLDITQRGGLSWTPLHFAAFQDNFASAQILLDSGADTTIKAAGQTSAELAFSQKCYTMGQLIENYSSSSNTKPAKR